MDPNFVDHEFATLTARVGEYLVFILFYATVVWGGVQGLLRLLGVKLEKTRLDEWLIAAVGMLVAVMRDLNAFNYVEGTTNVQWALSLTARAADGSPSAWFPVWLTILVANLLTGAMVVGGRRTIVGIAQSFGSGAQAIKDAMGNRQAPGRAPVEAKADQQ